jgi:hypothetical protein
MNFSRLHRSLWLTPFAASALVAACTTNVASTPDLTPGNADAGPVDSGTENDPTTRDTYPFEPGEKISAAAGEWSWVPFDDSSCANGKPTGIGINRGSSDKLVIYLEGGGACWDSTTCYVLKTATNIESGFDKAAFEARMTSANLKGGHMDRDSETNPFKDASFVYVPYCTGDVHSGSKEGNYDGNVTKHVGRKNIEAFLKRIVPTFDTVSRVVLTGSSAGGFGAAVNFWRVSHAFGTKVRVDLIDDSGPPFPSDKMKYIASWKTAWDLDAALPPGCDSCKDDLTTTIGYYSKQYPKSRVALLSYDKDSVIRRFFDLDESAFSTTLTSVVSEAFDGTPNARAFVVSGDKHTMLGALSTSTGSVTVASWLATMQDDSATWASTKP